MDQANPRKDGNPRVAVPAFDAKGDPRPKRVNLNTLLMAVGISPHEPEPGLAVLTQAQSELRALGELASQIGQDADESPDISHLGITLLGIYRRLDVAAELFDSSQTARRAGEDGDDSAEAPASGEEPPAS